MVDASWTGGALVGLDGTQLEVRGAPFTFPLLHPVGRSGEPLRVAALGDTGCRGGDVQACEAPSWVFAEVSAVSKLR